MNAQPQVLSDLSEFRTQLRDRGDAHQRLLRVGPTRPLFDILLDWLVVAGCIWMVEVSGAWAAPLAVVVIGNRQRALGNILHDAGHRNLCRNRRVNDLIASILVAPLVFASLPAYRRRHFQHHLALGDARQDPDFLTLSPDAQGSWLRSYWSKLAAPGAWLGSTFGDLVADDVGLRARLYILGWWAVALVVLAWAAGVEIVMLFGVLWMVSRATAFHLITTLREMCDHFGLQTGGIFSYTRDMVGLGVWRRIVHPRNNGYHLTHHLLPAIPYYRLPQAHRVFGETPIFRCKAQVCDAYFAGRAAVVRDWRHG